MTEPSPTPTPDLSEYQLGESVGYLLPRVKSTMSNLITQRSMAELGITSQQGSILFMVASGKRVRWQPNWPANTASTQARSRV